MSANEKSATVISLKLCLNCLHPGHRVSYCSAKGRCSKCKGKHHSSIQASKNSIPQHSAPMSSQLPSPANVHAAIVTHDAYNAASVTELQLSQLLSLSQQIAPYSWIQMRLIFNLPRRGL